MTPFPWATAMQFGFGVLRLPSKDFWALTPRELAAAFLARSSQRLGTLARNELTQLMERFPDEQ